MKIKNTFATYIFILLIQKYFCHIFFSNFNSKDFFAFLFLLLQFFFFFQFRTFLFFKVPVSICHFCRLDFIFIFSMLVSCIFCAYILHIRLPLCHCKQGLCYRNISICHFKWIVNCIVNTARK